MNNLQIEIIHIGMDKPENKKNKPQIRPNEWLYQIECPLVNEEILIINRINHKTEHDGKWINEQKEKKRIKRGLFMNILLLVTFNDLTCFISVISK